MHLHKRLRRFHGHLVQSLDNLLPSDDESSLPTASDSAPSPSEWARSTRTLGDSQTSNLPPPPPNDGSSMDVREQPLTASQSTPAPIGTEGDGTNTWPRLISFLRILDQSPIAFGPLKVVTSGLVDCIEIYEVSVLISSSTLFMC